MAQYATPPLNTVRVKVHTESTPKSNLYINSHSQKMYIDFTLKLTNVLTVYTPGYLFTVQRVVQLRR